MYLSKSNFIFPRSAPTNGHERAMKKHMLKYIYRMVLSSRPASCGQHGRRLPAVAARGRHPTPSLATHPCREQATVPDCTLPPTETHLRKYYANTTVLLRVASGMAQASAYNSHHTCTRGAREAPSRVPPPQPGAGGRAETPQTQAEGAQRDELLYLQVEVLPAPFPIWRHSHIRQSSG
jgi:hypothetical protein